MSQPDRSLGSKAVALLATAWILFLGGAICVALVLAFSPTPDQTLKRLGVGLGGMALLAFLLRDRRGETSLRQRFLWVSSHRATSDKSAYRPARQSGEPSRPESCGPPTVESIRELKDGLNTWVPSRSAAGRGTVHETPDRSPRDDKGGKNTPRDIL